MLRVQVHRIALAALITFVVGAAPASAQLNTQHLRPEVSLAIAKNNVIYGFLEVNYQWEVYARTNTKGSMATILMTFLAKPLHLPTM